MTESDKPDVFPANEFPADTRFFSKELSFFALLPDGRSFVDVARYGEEFPEFRKSNENSTSLGFEGRELDKTSLHAKYPALLFDS
ncbi:MAG TPA: hypothetical protein EYQ26_02865 [Rhodospirillales bacterium]|jgi:hypothetical protein|nr:hypothetical protein [Rhodospirillales bacterium]